MHGFTTVEQDLSQIEDNGKCPKQCDHCKEYFDPLEEDYKKAMELLTTHLRT